MARIRTEKEEHEFNARKLQNTLDRLECRPHRAQNVERCVTGTDVWSHYERLQLV